MGIQEFPQVEANATLAQVREIVAETNQILDFTINGKLDSRNIREIAGYLVSLTTFMHKSGLVGLNGADPLDPDAIRIWAGLADILTAPFRVNQSGQLFATDAFITGLITGSTIIGSEIMTAAVGVYPRSVMSANDNLFSAEVSAGYGVYIVPDYSLTTPAIFFNESGATRAIITLGTSPLSFAITTTGTTDISIQSAKDLVLSASGLVKFDSWGDIYSVGNGQTLQQALNAITGSISSGSYAVVTYSGGVPTSGRALIASDIPNIAESQVTNLVTDLSNKANKAQGSWIPLMLSNSWVNYDGVRTAGYYKDDFGIVRLKGVIKSGTTTDSTKIFDLPAGYRPIHIFSLTTQSNNGSGRIVSAIDVSPTGEVTIYNAGNTFFLLDGISFRADK